MSVPELLHISYREVSTLSTDSSLNIPSLLNNSDIKIDYGVKRNFLTQGSSFITPSQKLLNSTSSNSIINLKNKKIRKKVTKNYLYDCPEFPSYCKYLQNS